MPTTRLRICGGPRHHLVVLTRDLPIRTASLLVDNGLRCQATGFKAKDKSTEISSPPELVSVETTVPTVEPASSGPFAAKKEIPKLERLRARDLN